MLQSTVGDDGFAQCRMSCNAPFHVRVYCALLARCRYRPRLP